MAVPLFTIEQIELIRRLRNSGITKEQIILAFNQLDRLEAEFGKPNEIARPSNPAVIVHNSTLIPQMERRQSESPLGLIMSKPPSTSHTNGLTHSLRAEQQHSPYKVADYSRPQSNGNSTNGGTPLENSSLSNGELSPSASVTSPTSKLPSELTIIPISSSSSSSSEPPNNIPSENGPLVISKPDHAPFRSEDSVVPVHCMVNPHDLLQDEIAELEELKKRGDMEILSEIRNFVMRYNIKQTMIAEMTKMSQAYVSRFFRGDIQDMSDRTKHTFYMWYLTCKNNPWKLTQLCPNSGVKRMVSESGDLIPLKRERFTFKASHLAVLERYYEKDPYPDAQTREQIVEECNRAVGQPLCHERDRVTLPVVNNWFNNRRKEAKKQLRQQHAAAMAAMSLTSLANTATPLQQALTWGQAAFPTNLSLGGGSNSTVGAPEPMVDSDDSSDSMVDETTPPPPVKQEL